MFKRVLAVLWCAVLVLLLSINFSTCHAAVFFYGNCSVNLPEGKDWSEVAPQQGLIKTLVYLHFGKNKKNTLGSILIIPPGKLPFRDYGVLTTSERNAAARDVINLCRQQINPNEFAVTGEDYDYKNLAKYNIPYFYCVINYKRHGNNTLSNTKFVYVVVKDYTMYAFEGMMSYTVGSNPSEDGQDYFIEGLYKMVTSITFR